MTQPAAHTIRVEPAAILMSHDRGKVLGAFQVFRDEVLAERYGIGFEQT